jgi:hypothetical protein
MFDLLHNFWFLVAVTIIVCSVTATIAQAWQKVRRDHQEFLLKSDMLERGLSVDEMERVLRANSKTVVKIASSADEKAVADLVDNLGMYGVSGRVIEQVLAAVRSADPAFRRALCRAVKGVMENSKLEGEAKDEQVLAVVRGLSPAGRPAAAEDVPPASPAKIEETFQPLRPV